MIRIQAWTLLFLQILLLAWTPASAQDPCNHVLRGRILDADNKTPIANVSISLLDGSKSTITDSEGRFVLEGLCNEKATVEVSCIGYANLLCEQECEHDSHIYLNEEIEELEEVVIAVEGPVESGSRSMAQNRLQKADIQSMPTLTLAAALAETDGVSMASAGSNVQQPVIHGLYGNRILIINNGLKHGFQNWGSDHAPEIDPEGAHALTVIKGAGGVRYGPEAMGGVVLVEPNPMRLHQDFYGAVGTGYESNGHGVTANMEFGQGWHNWSYFVSGHGTKVGDRKAPDYMLTNTGKEEYAFNGGLRYNNKDWDFKAYYSYMDQNLALLRSSVAESPDGFINAINAERPAIVNPFSYDINEPNQLTTHHLAKAELSWNYREGASLNLQAGSQLNKRQEYDVRRNADKPIINLDLITNDVQLDWVHGAWGVMDGSMGFQYFSQNNDNNPGTGTTPFIPNYNVARYSFYMIESLKLSKATLEMGLRLDHQYSNVRGRETNQDIFRDEFSITNPTFSLGLVMDVTENSIFRSNIGSAWRMPNMAELYSFGQHGFKTTYGLLRYYINDEGDIRTDKVIPMDESGVKAENGFKWINEWTGYYGSNTLNITGYAHYITNFVYERPAGVSGTVRGPMPVFVYDQVDAAFVGADLTWKREWSEQWSTDLGWSYLWSRNVEDGAPLINQPPMKISATVKWDQRSWLKLDEANLQIKPSYTFTQWSAPRTIPPEEIIYGDEDLDLQTEIFDFKDAPEGYFLLDISWNLRKGAWQGGLAVQNVLNTSYRDYLNGMRYFADELGTNVLLTIKYNLNTNSNK